jgi:hypothetical protein
MLSTNGSHRFRPDVFLIAAAIFLGFASGMGTAMAGPLTVYGDQASWNAAVSGLTVGPYTGGITQAVTRTTIETGPASGCATSLCTIGSATTTSSGTGLSSLNYNFSFSSPCESTPGCMITSTSDVLLTFSQPISGFAASAIGDSDNALQVNGLGTGIFNCGCSLFFGLSGPISTLDFHVTGFTDNPETLALSNIVVATVPEPSTWSLIMAAIATLILYRVKKSAPASSRRRQPRAS